MPPVQIDSAQNTEPAGELLLGLFRASWISLPTYAPAIDSWPVILAPSWPSAIHFSQIPNPFLLQSAL